MMILGVVIIFFAVDGVRDSDFEMDARDKSLGCVVLGILGQGSWVSMVHGFLGFLGFLVGWCLKTFPRYQCNESRIFESEEGSGKFESRMIMYLVQFTWVYIVNYRANYSKINIELIMSQGLCR
jgi:hypothetical protein